MEIQFSPEVQAKLDRIAAENEMAADEYVSQLATQYVDHDEWFRKKVRRGLQQLDQGQQIEHDAVVERIERLLDA